MGFAKIMENMELGHNVMHGQYDWMNDPKFNGQTTNGIPLEPRITGVKPITINTIPIPMLRYG